MKPIYVVKFGGSLLEKPRALAAFARDAAAVSKKARLVVVHGGGKELSRWLDRLSIPYHFVDGQRFTSREAAVVAEMVLGGLVNKQIVAAFVKKGLPSVGLSLADGSLAALKRRARLGYIGEPVQVRPAVIQTLLGKGFVPVIATSGRGPRGERLNVNADSVCPPLATALGAERLMYLTDVDGILDQSGRTIPTVRARDVERLIRTGVIHSGMVPKIRAAVRALASGVREIDIVPATAGIAFDRGTRLLA